MAPITVQVTAIAEEGEDEDSDDEIKLISDIWGGNKYVESEQDNQTNKDYKRRLSEIELEEKERD